MRRRGQRFNRGTPPLLPGGQVEEAPPVDREAGSGYIQQHGMLVFT